jgi:hypothetical protein
MTASHAAALASWEICLFILLFYTGPKLLRGDSILNLTARRSGLPTGSCGAGVRVKLADVSTSCTSLDIGLACDDDFRL